MQVFSAGVFYSWLLLACFYRESYLKLSTINKSVVIIVIIIIIIYGVSRECIKTGPNEPKENTRSSTELSQRICLGKIWTITKEHSVLLSKIIFFLTKYLHFCNYFA